MSAYKSLYWPSVSSNIETIASFQKVGPDLQVRLNSNSAQIPQSRAGVYTLQDMVREVSISSVSDLSGIQVEITGLSCPIDAGTGNPTEQLSVFTESIVGPNNETKDTDRIYKRVDSVRLTGPIGIDEIALGFGSQGITDYIFLNIESISPQHWGIQGQVINPTTNPNPAFTYQFYGSMTKPFVITNNGISTPFPEPLPSFSLTGAASSTNSIIQNLAGVQAGLISIVWAVVKDETLPPNELDNSFYLTFIQQGISK